MTSFKIPENEYDSAKDAIEKILDTDIEDIEITDTLPLLDSLEDSNKVFKGDLSILFVDMRKSSDITEDLGSREMAKIYRSFIRIIIQSIRYSGGHSRQFAGDGIMGVFQDDYTDDGEIKITSSQKAIKAGRYISTLIDHCLNPVLQEYYSDLIIGYGIGIGTGEIMMTKAGMRGREGDETVENEVGIIWVGSTTNYASKLCDLCESGELFIDNETYDKIADFDNVWEKVSKVKGTKTYEGYLTKNYYLELPEELIVDPITSDEENNTTQQTFIQKIFEETKKEASELIDEIIEKSEKLGKKLKEVEKQDQEISVKKDKLSQKEREFKEKRRINLKKELETYKQLFASVYLKPEIVKSTGKKFWNKSIENAIEIGNDLDMSRSEVLEKLEFHLYPIYCYLSDYDNAYDSLCRLAEKKRYINWDIAKEVAMKRGEWYTLERMLERVTKENSSNKSDLLKLLNVLKSLKN